MVRLNITKIISNKSKNDIFDKLHKNKYRNEPLVSISLSSTCMEKRLEYKDLITNKIWVPMIVLKDLFYMTLYDSYKMKPKVWLI